MGVDVEEAASCRDTAAGALLVAGEGQIDHLRVLLPQPRQLRLQLGSLGVAGGKLPAVLGHRHKFHKDDHLAAAVGQRF